MTTTHLLTLVIPCSEHMRAGGVLAYFIFGAAACLIGCVFSLVALVFGLLLLRRRSPQLEKTHLTVSGWVFLAGGAIALVPTVAIGLSAALAAAMTTGLEGDQNFAVAYWRELLAAGVLGVLLVLLGFLLVFLSKRPRWAYWGSHILSFSLITAGALGATCIPLWVLDRLAEPPTMTLSDIAIALQGIAPGAAALVSLRCWRDYSATSSSRSG